MQGTTFQEETKFPITDDVQVTWIIHLVRFQGDSALHGSEKKSPRFCESSGKQTFTIKIRALEFPLKSKRISHNLQRPKWTTSGAKRANTVLSLLPYASSESPEEEKSNPEYHSLLFPNLVFQRTGVKITGTGRHNSLSLVLLLSSCFCSMISFSTLQT